MTESSQPIYLDNHATTPVDPRVVEAMLPYLTERFGNPSSSSHAFGWDAHEAVEMARIEVARLIGARADEVLFTSGATESDNLALLGVAARPRQHGRHIITTVLEHPAVLDTVSHLEREGAEITRVGVDSSGVIDPEAIRAALRPDTILISVIAANNEIGTIQPLAEIGEIAAEHGCLFHSDAAQAAGRIPLDVGELGLHLASISAHKMYGPKGIGALYVRRRDPLVRIEPLMYGGGQERGLRPGTLPVPNIVGFARACTLARAELEDEAQRLRSLRDRLLAGLTAELDHLHVNGDLERRLPGNLNMSFAYIDGEALITGLRSIAVSSGSACSSDAKEPSYVLSAIGVSAELAHGALRFGLGRFNTAEQIEFTIREVSDVVRRLRAISPFHEAAASTAHEDGSART